MEVKFCWSCGKGVEEDSHVQCYPAPIITLKTPKHLLPVCGGQSGEKKFVLGKTGDPFCSRAEFLLGLGIELGKEY